MSDTTKFVVTFRGQSLEFDSPEQFRVEFAKAIARGRARREAAAKVSGYYNRLVAPVLGRVYALAKRQPTEAGHVRTITFRKKRYGSRLSSGVIAGQVVEG